MKKYLSSLVLCLLLTMALCAPSHAAQRGEADAAALHELGLFQGIGNLSNGSPDFALDAPLTRQEAVVMLVRLLGEEQTALAGEWTTPFTDVASWAKPYVGYAYSRGLTLGAGATTFGGAQPVSATQYLTFILRALGYSSDTDFRWDAAWELADTLGVTHGEYGDSTDSFLRGDAAFLSRSALMTRRKDGGGTLLDQLIASGAVSQEAAQENSLLSNPYTAMARALLQSGRDPITLTLDENGCISAKVLPNVPQFQTYDAYFTGGTTVEDAMVSALMRYGAECMDGDYSDGYPGTVTFGVGTANQAAGAFLLTDTEGTIIAYGTLLEDVDAGDTVTLYCCDLDSRPYLAPLAEELQAALKGVKVLHCTGEKIGEQYVYTIADLPENAAYYTLNSLGYSTSASISQRASKEKIIGTQMGLCQAMSLQKGTLLPITDGIAEEAVTISGEWSYHLKAITLWDADQKPIAFAYVAIPR